MAVWASCAGHGAAQVKARTGRNSAAKEGIFIFIPNRLNGSSVQKFKVVIEREAENAASRAIGVKARVCGVLRDAERFYATPAIHKMV
jgi:hypothetical protein